MTIKFCFFDCLALSKSSSNPPTNFCIFPNSFSLSESKDYYIFLLMSFMVKRQKSPVSRSIQTSITILIMTVVVKLSSLLSTLPLYSAFNAVSYAAFYAFCSLSRTTHSLLREPSETLIMPVKLSEAARLTNLFSEVK